MSHKTMVTIIIDQYKKLILSEDKIIFCRSDVITESLKEQVFLIETIRKAVIKPRTVNWSGFILWNLFMSLFDTRVDTLDGEYDRLKIVFVNSTFKYIDTGKLPLSKIKEIRNQINLHLTLSN